MMSKLRLAFLGKLAVLATLGLSYCTVGCHHDHDDDEGGGRHAGWYDRGDRGDRGDYGHDHYYNHDRYDHDYH